MDLRSKDNRGSTPLHWACYSKSEIALCYILSWLQNLDDRDIEGYTPLHLAVKSVESLRSTRPVRSLLIRGASRDILDNNNRKPIELVELISHADLQRELKQMLRPPSGCSCLMIKTPLKLMRKSIVTPMFFLLLIIFNYFVLLFLILPCKVSYPIILQ